MIKKWKDLANAGTAARDQWVMYPTTSDFAAGRQQMNHILGKFGIDTWTCVKKFNRDPNFPRMPLWKDGPCWEDFRGDARPDMPPPDGNMECDLYLTGYDPHFWKSWFPSPCKVKCSGKGVYPGPDSSKSANHGSKVSGVDSGYDTEWLSWHGTHLYGAITAIAGNFLMRSESIPGGPSDKATDFKDKFGFEHAAGRGIYTSQSWHKALQYGIPFFWDGVKVPARMVLLTMAPGGSQQELGTVFKVSEGKAKGRLWQNNQKIDRWQIIPCGQFHQEMLEVIGAAPHGIFRALRESGKEFRPPSVAKLVEASQFEPFPELQCRTSRLDMQQKAHAGHTGEGAWSITDPTAEEVISSMVHIVGVVVMYQGQANSKTTFCPSRKRCTMSDFNTILLPNWARPKATTSSDATEEDEDPYDDDMPDWG